MLQAGSFSESAKTKRPRADHELPRQIHAVRYWKIQDYENPASGEVDAWE
jgi:hypothetical protein